MCLLSASNKFAKILRCPLMFPYGRHVVAGPAFLVKGWRLTDINEQIFVGQWHALRIPPLDLSQAPGSLIVPPDVYLDDHSIAAAELVGDDCETSQ